MMDYNVLNRGAFSQSELKFNITVESNDSTVMLHSIPEGDTFSIEGVRWRYDVGSGWPKSPLLVSINSVIEDEVSSPNIFNPPKLLREKIEICVRNPSTIKVTLCLTITGISTAAVEGQPLLSDKEILGYMLLDNAQKGLLALEEASVDRIDEHLKKLGMPGVRLPSLAGQTRQLGIEETKLSRQLSSPEEYKALSIDDDSEILSLLIGDLVGYKTTNSSDLSLEEIQSIADYLLAKKWQR